jgi:hypothetical protein
MGSRANYVITENGRHDLYYSHWGAQRVGRDFFFGPDVALATVRATKPCEPPWGDGLLDDVWAEGGAVVDVDARRLRLWGGEDIAFDARERELWLELLTLSWPGWEVAWADRGIFDLADQLGVPHADVRGSAGAWATKPVKPLAAEERPRLCYGTLVTLRGAGGEGGVASTDHAVKATPPIVLGAGPDALPDVAAMPVLRRLPDEPDWPTQCVLFDLVARQLWVCDDSTYAPSDAEDVRALWPGWAVTFHVGGLPAHLRLTGRDPDAFAPPIEAHVQNIGRMVLGGDVDPGAMLRALEGDARTRPTEVNPNFLQRHGVAMAEAARIEHFLAVLSAWRRARGA